MGISALPALARTHGNANSASGPLADDSAAVDFSALLAGQIEGLAPANEPAAESAGLPVSAGKGESVPPDIAALLAAQLANPSIATAQATGESGAMDRIPASTKRLGTRADGPPAAGLATTEIMISSDPVTGHKKSADTPASLAGAYQGIPNQQEANLRPPSNAAISASHSDSFKVESAEISITLDKRFVASGAQAEAAAKLAGEPLPPAMPSIPPGVLHERPTAEAKSALPQFNVQTPLHDSRWSQDFGDRITWLAKNELQTAQINITPANLGPIQINLSLQDDQLSASFAAAHPEARQALEEAMPRLREMLTNAGINLDQANVGAQLQQRQRENMPQFAATPRSTVEEAILPADNQGGTNVAGATLQRGRGLVDLFA